MERTFDRVLLARHFALSAGAVAAYVFRSELQIGYAGLWIVGISVTLNFLAYLFRTQPRLTGICMVASPIIGVVGWSALIGLTNGAGSPFIAGLWLEVVLSAMALQLRGIALVTAGAVAALWLQQFLFVGLQGHGLPMMLQSGFLVGMGLATFLVTRRWLQRQALATQAHADLSVRLEALGRQLDDERALSALGENVARLAHGLKNMVHSLRGFLQLIEPKLESEGDQSAALKGLRRTIDDLEQLALLTLGPQSGQGAAAGSKKVSEWAPVAPNASEAEPLLPTVKRAVAEIEASHPGVSWDLVSDGASPDMPLSSASFAETLEIFLRNAVEAMQGQGKGSIETWVADAQLHVAIRDEGVGLDPADLSEIFKPGFTTKPNGSGYGLFLARRIIEEHGGQVTARPREKQGAMVELCLPLRDVASPRLAEP